MNKILWFIVRRVVVYATIGGIIGAICGAICISLAGAFIGLVASWVVKEYDLEIMVLGARIGLEFGANTGGGIGILGFGILGMIAPPARSLLPAKSVIGSMVKMMALATVFGVTAYFLWCAIFGIFRYGFSEAMQEGVFIAMFAVPALMGLGQIAGIWRAVSKLKKAGTIEVQI